MGSRTNSTQPLPRAKATSNSKSLRTAGPQKQTKSKKPSKTPKLRTKSSTMDRFLFIMLAIFSTYALWTCPSDIHLSNPICRSLSQYRTHVLDPYVLPPVQKVLLHPYVAPAVTKFYAVEHAVAPIVIRAHTVAQPYITKATQLTQATAMTAYAKLVTPMYNKHIQPLYQRHVDPLYMRYIYPRLHLLRSRVLDPYLRPLMLKTHLYANQLFWTLHRIYVAAAPRIYSAYVRARPFMDRAWEVAKPYVVKSVDTSLKLFGLLLEKSAEARRQFVDPHVIKIWEKVVELSGSTGTTTSSTAFSVSTTLSETKATSAEAESETVQSGSSSVPSVSISTSLSVFSEPSETASVPEESSLPLETSTSEEPTLSSTIMESETSTTSEISASTSSFASSDSASIFTTYDSTSTPGIANPGTSREETLDSEDDLDNFFADLGLLEDEQNETGDSTEASAVDTEQDTSISPEESAAARRIATAKKRAELEARMEKWHADLDGLMKRRTKEFRKELVRVRKGAVRSLFPDPEKDNGDLEEALTHIRGEDVAGILERFEKESEKLLKGLESYLKKEEKLVSDSSNVDVDDRMKRWFNVVKRVEERFIERINGLQEKIHWWYLEVRELEVQEYHRATKEVKTFAQKAQGDMGMPMAWLDDVTYQDWQKYHDLIRAHERFDEQIRMIQNGTHPSPPIDPLVPALDKLQLELDDAKNGFDTRVRTLSAQIHHILSPPQKEEQEGEASSEEPVSGEGEKFSILPIDPVPTSPVMDGQEEFEEANIIIGKSKEQVEEAIRIAQESVHEEL
ncbi:hypothetical protein F5876DRAFT_43345 [Lentinula aff. lateritia]|uniref:Uncharacterized protein n=1 Tax=Lentinula aff. lateritia TaxID=2804960 RepID=A0ACC1TY51_9AGAR|nr:hypothetical protein F5876DRAFT_43345 [Lentinula aff. lateritia]